MKFNIALAALLFAGKVTCSEYATSEGPTKVDLGENDDDALARADTTKNGWENPLSWTDDGTDDEVVVTMVDGSLISTRALRQKLHQMKKKHHHQKRHHNKHHGGHQQAAMAQ